MGNTKNPESTPFHDGYRLGADTAPDATAEEQAAVLLVEMNKIEDYDDQEAFAEGFWNGVETVEAS